MDLVGTASVTDPMYTIAPGQRHEIEFDVLPGDVEALVVLFDYEGMRLPFYCLSPSGEIIDAGLIPPGYQLRSGWTPQTRFLTFKMPALDPALTPAAGRSSSSITDRSAWDHRSSRVIAAASCPRSAGRRRTPCSTGSPSAWAATSAWRRSLLRLPCMSAIRFSFPPWSPRPVCRSWAHS